MLKFHYDTTLNSQPSPQMSREEENSLNQRIYWRAEHAKISERVRILKSKRIIDNWLNCNTLS